MASKEKTPNLKLSNFAIDDTPSWLTDYNADMQLLDNAFAPGGNGVVKCSSYSRKADIWGSAWFINKAATPKLFTLGSDGGNPTEVYLVNTSYYALLNKNQDFTGTNNFKGVTNFYGSPRISANSSTGALHFGAPDKQAGKMEFHSGNGAANFSLSNGFYNFRNHNQTVWGTLNIKETLLNSDRRLKKDIDDIDESFVEKYMALRPRKYRYLQDDSIGYGFVAQETQEVMPEMVSQADPEDTDSTLSLRYGQLHGLEAMMIQRHERELKKIDALTQRLERLEELLADAKSG